MSNTVLGDINNHEKKRPARKPFSEGRDNNAPSRSTRSKIERQERLRVLCAESRSFSSVDNIHPVLSSGGEIRSIADADAHNCPQLHQRATARRILLKQKENVEKNSMSPEGGSSSEDCDGGAAPAVSGAGTKKLAVTPSPNPNKLSDSPDTKDDVGNPGEVPPSSESAEERACRRAAWPMTDIMEPGNNDCLFGRGGGTNHHPGNKLYRKMVEDKKGKYLASKRLDKPLVAMEIIADWRALDPPGRFLKQDDHTKLWNDVGDKKAREKTSQALREKTPTKLRDGGGGGDDHLHHHRSGGLGHHRTTRFEPGTNSPVGRHVKRPGLARDHSLGETVLGSKDICIEGFSWDDSERPVVRNADADVEGRRRASRHHHGEHYEHHHGGEYHSRDYNREHRQPPHRYRRDHNLSKNPLSDASAPHLSPNAYGEQPPPSSSSYYGHHYPGCGPPPPSSHGHLHHPPPYHSHHHYPNSPENHHHHSENNTRYSRPPPQQQRSREHSLQMNPLTGATTSQAAREMFNDEEGQASSAYDSRRPPPLPSPTYDSRYDSRGPQPVPSPYYSGVGYGSPQHGWPSPPPRPQFTYHPGSNPSAFGRYDSSRSNSLRSLGSSIDAFYDRGDSSSSGRADSRGGHNRPAENPSSAGTPQDYSKIAELIRDSSEQTSGGMERSSSWDQGGSAGRNDADYEDTIQRSKSMPFEESGGIVAGTPAGPGIAREVKEDKKGQTLSLAGVQKPSLIRKLSGGAMTRNGSSHAAAPKGILRPEPRRDVAGAIRPETVKRETSNQPETMETKRSIKRVVLSRDQSAVARRLKEEQVTLQQTVPGPCPAIDTCAKPRPVRVSRGLSKAEMLDRKLSVEVSKLGLEDINENNARGGALSRMTTEDVLTSLIDDDGLASPSPDLLGCPVGSPLAAPPEPLEAGDRVTTIDAIAIDIANGNNVQQDNAEWDNALDLVEEPCVEPSETSESAGVNADIAEKWLKGET